MTRDFSLNSPKYKFRTCCVQKLFFCFCFEIKTILVKFIYSEKATKFCEISTDWHYIGQIYGGDFAKMCGLLRINELYVQKYSWPNTGRRFWLFQCMQSGWLPSWKHQRAEHLSPLAPSMCLTLLGLHTCLNREEFHATQVSNFFPLLHHYRPQVPRP